MKLNCEPCSNVVALIEIETSLLALNRDASWYFSHIRTVFLFEGTWGISHCQGGTLTWAAVLTRMSSSAMNLMGRRASSVSRITDVAWLASSHLSSVSSDVGAMRLLPFQKDWGRATWHVSCKRFTFGVKPATDLFEWPTRLTKEQPTSHNIIFRHRELMANRGWCYT